MPQFSDDLFLGTAVAYQGIDFYWLHSHHHTDRHGNAVGRPHCSGYVH
jgi:hypothetical protein